MTCNRANVKFIRWLRAALLNGPSGVAPHYALTEERLLPWLVFMTLFPTWATHPPLPKPAGYSQILRQQHSVAYKGHHSIPCVPAPSGDMPAPRTSVLNVTDDLVQHHPCNR